MGGMEGAQEGPCFGLEHRWVQQGKLRPRQVGSGNSGFQPQGTLRPQGCDVYGAAEENLLSTHRATLWLLS